MPGASSYERIVPQAGRMPSLVLGLELTVEAGLLRFYDATAPLLITDEIVGRVEAMVAELIESRDAAVRRADAPASEVLRAELERAKRGG